MDKFFCYVMLFIALFIYYQENPVGTLIIIVLGLGLYLFLRLKKRGNQGKNLKLLGKKKQSGEISNQDLLNFFIITELLQKNNRPYNKPMRSDLSNSKKSLKIQNIEEIKENILMILEGN